MPIVMRRLDCPEKFYSVNWHARKNANMELVHAKKIEGGKLVGITVLDHAAWPRNQKAVAELDKNFTQHRAGGPAKRGKTKVPPTKAQEPQPETEPEEPEEEDELDEEEIDFGALDEDDEGEIPAAAVTKPIKQRDMTSKKGA